jgi:hypothetical protein
MELYQDIKQKSKLVIITAYRPCKAYRPTTAWMQQWSLLQEQGIKTPDPIKIFYEDLTLALEKWQFGRSRTNTHARRKRTAW